MQNAPDNIKVMEVGNERTKVLIIDDLFSKIDFIRERIANEATFEEPKTYYPGVTARAFLPYRRSIIRIADKVARYYYGIPHDKRILPRRAFFSFITTLPDQLSPPQREPHFDFPAYEAFAALHYIAEGEHGGTGFFRHKPTGIERVSPANLENFHQARIEFNNLNGGPPPGFISGTTSHYEMIGEAAYRPNRLVIYPGSLLHSALVDPLRDISTPDEPKRLTGNVFFAYGPAAATNPDAGKTLAF